MIYFSEDVQNFHFGQIRFLERIFLGFLLALGLFVGGESALAEQLAKKAFGAQKKPADLPYEAIGFYSRGCLAGAKSLPINGPAWQVMRLERNRTWGHPELLRTVKELAVKSKQIDGWPGLLIGDLSQPRGGPMLSGHVSHQIGLDADVWMMPMPNRRLSRKERRHLSAVSMLKSQTEVDLSGWKNGHVKLIKRAALFPQVERILVHPAIKKQLCLSAGQDRSWLSKVRPYWGHHYHFHMRLACPKTSKDCVPQKKIPSTDGCGKELEKWFKVLTDKSPKRKKKKKAFKRKLIKVGDLPKRCQKVLDSPQRSLRGSEMSRWKGTLQVVGSKLAPTVRILGEKH